MFFFYVNVKRFWDAEFVINDTNFGCVTFSHWTEFQSDHIRNIFGADQLSSCSQSPVIVLYDDLIRPYHCFFFSNTLCALTLKVWIQSSNMQDKENQHLFTAY